MNNFSLAGRIIEDAIVEKTENGLKLARVKLSVNKYGKDEQAEIFEVKLWGDLAEEDLTAGRIMDVKGRLSANNVEKEEKTYYNVQFVAEKISFLA